MVTLHHPAVEEALYQGLEDWVQLTVIEWVIETEPSSWWRDEGAPSPADIKAETLAVCEFLLSQGLMCAGELSNSTDDPGDFLDWPGEPSDIVARIGRDWDRLTSRERFTPCWFRSTPAGIEAGKRVDE